MNATASNCVYSCEASMYVDKVKKWAYGRFFITSRGIYFECNKDSVEETNFIGMTIDYDEMSCVMKEISTFIFPSLTIYVGQTKYWFSSFPNRGTVYLLIEHFQKEGLLSTEKTENQGRQTPGSQLGHELLAIAHDSAKTLTSAGRSLHRQGKQLDYALMTANSVKQELDVSENLIGQMESPFGLVFSTPRTGQDAPKTITRRKEIKILFSKSIGAKSTSMQTGLLRISDFDMLVLNDKGIQVFEFTKDNDGDIKIQAPWEFVICKRRAGSTDIVCDVTAAQFVLIEPLMKKYFSKKLQYVKPESTQRRKIPSTLGCSSFGGQLINQPNLETQNQIQQPIEDEISQQEAKELLQMISDMKSLAVDLGQEQAQQLETIDAITTVVDNCDIQMKDETRRIRRLM